MTHIDLLDHSHLILVLTFFCLVQSVFGMGLLVFGTPTLIILNVPFVDCLLLLLPASLTISLMQMGSIDYFRRLELGRSIPLLVGAVAVGFMVHILPLGPVRLEGLLGVVLFSYGLARMSARIEAGAAAFVRDRTLSMTAAMGVLHGISNMGGAILAIISSSRYSDKNDLRTFVAANYAILATAQLIVLLLVLERWPIASVAASSAIAMSAYMLLGRRVYGAIGTRAFRHLFTAFIFMYSIALLWKFLQHSSAA